MSYLLKRIRTPGAANYVAPPGSPKAYVTKAKARVYATRAEAEADRCPENEVIVHQNTGD
jgi:hypothetical protein